MPCRYRAPTILLESGNSGQRKLRHHKKPRRVKPVGTQKYRRNRVVGLHLCSGNGSTDESLLRVRGYLGAVLQWWQSSSGCNWLISWRPAIATGAHCRLLRSAQRARQARAVHNEIRLVKAQIQNIKARPDCKNRLKGLVSAKVRRLKNPRPSANVFVAIVSKITS